MDESWILLFHCYPWLQHFIVTNTNIELVKSKMKEKKSFIYLMRNFALFYSLFEVRSEYMLFSNIWFSRLIDAKTADVHHHDRLLRFYVEFHWPRISSGRNDITVSISPSVKVAYSPLTHVSLFQETLFFNVFTLRYLMSFILLYVAYLKATSWRCQDDSAGKISPRWWIYIRKKRTNAWNLSSWLLHRHIYTTPK